MRKTGTVPIFLAFLAAAPCLAQNLPDPGRRLSTEEQKAGPEQRPPAQRPSPSAKPARDAKLCERARIHYQLTCRAPNGPQSRSMECAEAYALYRQACE